MTHRLSYLLLALLFLAGCVHDKPKHDAPDSVIDLTPGIEDAGADMVIHRFRSAGPVSLPIQYLVPPDGSDQLIVCSSDGGCAYGPNTAIGGAIIWRPGGTASGNVFTTCATVSAALAASPGSSVWVDTTLGTATIPTGCTLDFGGYGGLVAYYNNALLDVTGTGQIKNMPACTGMVIEASSTTTAALSWNWTAPDWGPAVIMSDCFIQEASLATASPIQVPANVDGGIVGIAFEMFNGSGFTRLGGNTTPIMTIGAGSSALLYYSDYSVTQTPLWSTIASGAGALLVYGDDTLFPFPTQSGLSGGLSRLPLSRMTGAGGLWYDASANVVGGAPTCIGPPPYCFADASPEPTGVGEVLQIVQAGPLMKFAPINGTVANSFVACDGGGVLTGHDGGGGEWCNYAGGGGGGVTSVSGSAPISCSPTTGASTCSLSGVVALANGGTGPLSGLTTGNTLHAASSTTDSWGALNLAGGSGYVTGSLPIGNVAPGTSAQVLMSNATPATTWTTLSGDTTIGATGVTTTGSLQGGGNSGISVGTTNGLLTCGVTTGNCGFAQTGGSGISAVGNTIQIFAQAEVGSGSTGGNVSIQAATGAAANGVLKFGVGGTDVWRLNVATASETTGELDVLSGNNVAVGSSSSIQTSGTNTLAFVHGTAPSSCGGNACIWGTPVGLGVMDDSSNTVGITGTSIAFNGAATTTISQTIPSYSLAFSTSNGTGAASASGVSGAISVATGNAAVATSGTAAGAVSGGVTLATGNGANGLGGTSNGGIPSPIDLIAGNGGNAVSTGVSGAGGAVNIVAGNPGTAASGTTGAPGSINLTSGQQIAGGVATGSGQGVWANSVSVLSGTFTTQLDYALGGVHNSQENAIVKAACNKRLTGVSQTTTCAIQPINSTAVNFRDIRCIGRTVTAGTSGNVTDSTIIESTRTAAASPAICSTTSGGTTTCAVGITASLNNTGTQNLTTCVLSAVSNVPTVTLTTASNGAGMVVDTTILIDAEQI